MGNLIVREADGNPSCYMKEPVAHLLIIDGIPGYESTDEGHRVRLRQAHNVSGGRGHTLPCDCQQGVSYPPLSKMAKAGELT